MVSQDDLPDMPLITRLHAQLINYALGYCEILRQATPRHQVSSGYLVIAMGCAIGATTVVTQSLSPSYIASGNPAKIFRKRLSMRDIKLLLSLRWWRVFDADLERISPFFYCCVPAFAFDASEIFQRKTQGIHAGESKP